MRDSDVFAILRSMDKHTVKLAAFHALGAAFYVLFVAHVMRFASSHAGPDGESVFPAIAFLMLFSFSAAVMGLLVFGRPIVWFVAGKKKEAIELAIATVAGFGLLTLIVLVSVFFAL